MILRVSSVILFYCYIISNAHADEFGKCKGTNSSFKSVIEACTNLIDDKGATLSTKVRAYIQRGIQYGSAKNHHTYDSQAISDFSSAVRLDPKNDAAWFLRGQQYFSMKRIPEALSDYGSALKLAKSNSDAGRLIRGWYYLYRGVAYLCIGKFDKAISDCEQLIDGPYFSGEGTMCRGLAFERQGKSELAKQSFEEALRKKTSWTKADFESECAKH